MKISELTVPVGNIELKGNLNVPANASVLVVFSHGSGSSRFSSRNRHVAGILNKNNMATLLTDLLTEKEDNIFENRFDIGLITGRLMQVIKHAKQSPGLEDLPVGCFGANTGAASALRAAALMPDTVKAVVSRGGRPDLTGNALVNVRASTLLIVGSLDVDVVALNEEAYTRLACEKEIKIVTGASHLFEEPGKLDEVATLAAEWFNRHLSPASKLPPS